jgi:hypothetical protein
MLCMLALLLLARARCKTAKRPLSAAAAPQASATTKAAAPASRAVGLQHAWRTDNPIQRRSPQLPPQLRQQARQQGGGGRLLEQRGLFPPQQQRRAVHKSLFGQPQNVEPARADFDFMNNPLFGRLIDR